MKMLAATMPTNPAAIHSIVSMKRSMDARFIVGSPALAMAGKTRRRENPAAATGCNEPLLRQGVVFGQSGTQFGHRRVRVGAGFLDAFGPGLDQRLGRFPP